MQKYYMPIILALCCTVCNDVSMKTYTYSRKTFITFSHPFIFLPMILTEKTVETYANEFHVQKLSVTYTACKFHQKTNKGNPPT